MPEPAKLSMWADILGIVGFFITIGGFVVTVVGVRKAKKAAQLAKEAAEQAKERIQKHTAFENFALAITTMESLLGSHRKGEWEAAVDQYSQIKRILIELKDSGSGLSSQQQTEVQASVEQIKLIERQTEKFLSDGKTQPKVHIVNGVIKDQIERIHSISIQFKNQ